MADSVSIMASTYTTLGVTQIMPLITWIEGGCPLPAPDPVNALFAVVIVGAIHLGQKAFSHYIGDPDVPADLPTKPLQESKS